MRSCLLLILSALALSTACGTDPASEMIGVPSTTTTPIRVGQITGSVVDVRVDGKNTVVRIHGARFVCAGHRGYLGQIGAEHGWVTVGKVTLQYSNRGIILRGPQRWARFKPGATPNLIVQQDGSTARSVFRS